MHPREYQSGDQKKTAWTKIGVLWLDDDGKKGSIELEYVPTTGVVQKDGTVRMGVRGMCFPPKERDAQHHTPAPTQHETAKANGYQPQAQQSFDDVPPF
jgi:hypothetical protein